MSLDHDQMSRTAQDLRRHVDATGLTPDDLAGWLGLDRTEVDHALAMDGQARPTTVWLLRDALDLAAREAGVDTGGWQVLTAANRARGQQWYHLAELPPRP